MTDKTHFGFEQVDAEDKARRVRGVFDSVAGKYDLMNDLMSAGLHRLWKRFAVDATGVRPGMRVLDLAGGTGDLARLFARPRRRRRARVVLTDINGAMLAAGRDKLLNAGRALPVVQCDAEQLPFGPATFDCVSIAFGLRNVTHKEVALAEMRRVLKPGGVAAVLEFSRVWAPLAPAYDWYSFNVIPRIGKLVAGDDASYRYLAESIRMHPDQATLKAMMERRRIRPRRGAQPRRRRRRAASRVRALTSPARDDRRDGAGGRTMKRFPILALAFAALTTIARGRRRRREATRRRPQPRRAAPERRAPGDIDGPCREPRDAGAARSQRREARCPRRRATLRRLALARTDRGHCRRTGSRRAALAFRSARRLRERPAPRTPRHRRRACCSARYSGAARRRQPWRRLVRRTANRPAGASSASSRCSPPCRAPPPSATSPIPAGFDTAGFLREAKLQFRRLQAAWDAGDRKALAAVMTPEMVAEILRDLDAARRARGDRSSSRSTPSCSK